MHYQSPLDVISQIVQGLYDAESQLILALPRVAFRAHDPGLRSALSNHLKQTRTHAVRLEQVADLLGIPASGKKSFAMQGLLKDGDEVMGHGWNDALVDAALMAACQEVEHFEMAAYTGLLNLLKQHQSPPEAIELLESTLREEQEASAKLEQLSSGVLAAA